MNPRFVYIVTHPASGCDPESDDYVAYLKRPILAWDSYVEFTPFSIDSFDPGRQLWALVQRTARCCGTGHKTLIVAYSRSRLRSMATVLNAGTPAWAAPRTDFEDREGIHVEPYRVIPLDVVDEAFEEYVYKPSNTVLDYNSNGWDDFLNNPLELSEDIFVDDPFKIS
jgi:hypothetical protein